ncbi:MAG: ABC transporter permease, partial [Treponema sp.]|nr:ABC transporter permease [Treponema sp.]
FIIFGTAIVILGNSFMESVNRGLEKDFRANYTGDLVVSANPPEGTIMDIFSVNSNSFTGEILQIPALTDIEQVQKVLDSTPEIEQKTKMISTQGILFKGDEIDLSAIQDDDSVGVLDIPMFIMFAGEGSSYFDVFGGQHIVEGRALDYSSGDNELLIDTRIKESFEKFFKESLNVGDDVLVMGANTNGVVREAKVVGFYTPANEHSAMFQTIYCTPDFARAFADLTYGTLMEENGESGVSLTDFSEEDFFGGDDDIFGDMISDETDTFENAEIQDYDSILGDTSLRDELNRTDNGAWHFVQAKIGDKTKTRQVVAELNQKFKEMDLDAVAMDWEAAGFSYTSSVKGINVLFNVLVIILAIVVFIIIMNTMVVSVMERTSEIGTMRALGAEKSFVRSLFNTEALMITVISALIGTSIALIFTLIFNSLGIAVDSNMVAKVILGGGEIQFAPTPQIVITTIVVVIIGSLLSNIYPVSSALKITPLKALSKGAD